MKSILDPTFKYTPAAATDIRKTFRRVRKEIEEAKERERVHQKIYELRRRRA